MSNKVICTLPNAGSKIDGIEFEDDDGAKVAYDVDDAQAERFATIPGFEVIGGAEKPEPAKVGRKSSKDAE